MPVSREFGYNVRLFETAGHYGAGIYSKGEKAMPIYEYRCESCAEKLEKIQKVSDPALTRCPACNKDSLVKLVSASAFRLSGTGWYETDFKDSGTKRNLADSDSNNQSSGSATQGSQTSPEGAKQAGSESSSGGSSGKSSGKSTDKSSSTSSSASSGSPVA